MPRPKSSKNKFTLEREQEQPVAVEFDYERDDGRFDNSYKPLSVTGSPNINIDYVNDPFSATSDSTSLASNKKMFLVEGDVQLTPRAAGRGAVVAKQFRLVMALNDNEAIAKYISYFVSLSDAEASYAVLNAAAMKTIE